MKFWLTYPLGSPGASSEFMAGSAIVRFARAVEDAGFDGLGFTDHPAPSEKWLRGGGHDALDPFAALAFVAGVTTRIALIPNIVVLPYRNPFLVAKLSATLDLVSGNRFFLSTALGYLRSEYRALGVDFDNRNQLFDEALEVLHGVWTTDSYAFAGTGFTAGGVSANPKPAHIPIWIGGNSQRTRRRVADYGDCWNPFMASETLASTTGTTRLETTADLALMLGYLWEQVDRAGRDRASIDVAFSAAYGDAGSSTFDADRHHAALSELSSIGVTWSSTSVPHDSLERALEAVAEYGERVIAPSHR